MSIENPVDPETNLDDFSADFFGQKQPAEVATNPPEEIEEVPEDAPTDDTHHEGDETLETEEETPEAEAEQPKPKKNRFQERIDEVVGKQREAERRAQALESQLQEAISKLNQASAPKSEAKPEDNEPKYTDLNADGTEKYPLGEFDAQYLRDYTMFHIQKGVNDRLAEAEGRTKEAQERARQEQQARDRQTAWEAKLEPARERYPDYQEKVESLVESLSDIDPSVGSYLSTQIMDMDHGTDVLYYLANHPDEARVIANSGSRAAIKLGALEERVRPKEDAKLPKASSAPKPPPSNRGATGAHQPIRGDEEDLSAFESEFFKRKR